MSDDLFETEAMQTEEDPFATEEQEVEEEFEEEVEEEAEEEDPFAEARESQPMTMPAFGVESQPTEDEFKLIREWTMKFREQNEEKDRASAEKRAATLQKAKDDIKEFYEKRQIKHDAKLQSAKEQEETFVESMKADIDLPNPWERVTKLVDFNTDNKKHEKDVQRMKQVIIRMKADAEKSL